MQNNNYQNQNQNQQQPQVIDRGNITVVVDKYPEKINGQVVLVPGPNNQQVPKMKNKYMSIGEATKWRQPDGSESTTEKIYLQPVVCLAPTTNKKPFGIANANNQQHSKPVVINNKQAATNKTATANK